LETKLFTYKESFALESGGVLPELELAYTTAGTLNGERDNVIWICHALTANADPQEWWPGLVGRDKLFDPAVHYIVCVNMLGSHYGSTGPLSDNPLTGDPYYHDFPAVTVRDMVNSLELLRSELDIHKIHTCIGGSMGGQQALEWAIMQPQLIENLVLIATNAQHSAWGIAFNEAQRMAIEVDPTWPQSRPDAGLNGMKAARATALLSYRNYETYLKTQTSYQPDKTEGYPASSYQRYQGEKLARRFNAFSYWTLSRAMDSHHVGRGRGSVTTALGRIRARTLVIGIATDVLFPVEEQRLLAAYIPDAHYEELESLYGHDGFLIECDQIAAQYKTFLNATTRVTASGE
jgi:homoserine O-acetyltransferase